MVLLALVALGLIAWAWMTGRLTGWTGQDALALAAVVIGAKLLTGGGVAIGLLLAGGGALWIGRHWGRLRGAVLARRPANAADLDAARDLLGILPWADERAIRAAYRNRIVTAHPDTGGDTASATRLAAARDLLLADLAARTRI